MDTITTTATRAAPEIVSGDELARYDLARAQVRSALAGQLPGTLDAEAVAAARAYWICSAVDRGAEWETTLRKHIDHALRDALRDAEAEQAEFALLRNALSKTSQQQLLLDVGAGWGRMAPLYRQLGRPAVYVEPNTLGASLMRRSGLRPVVTAVGEALPFPSATFGAALIGWVLHHHPGDLNANAILAETARVLAPGGWLLSIEPIRESFGLGQWRDLLAQPSVAIAVCEVEEFYHMPTASGSSERYTFLLGQKPAASYAEQQKR